MKIIVITGQTATGKTNLALKLAKENNGELVNSDSRQIYQHLDIITGKDRPNDVKVWLYDFIDPKEYFSSFDYVQAVYPIIKDILSRKKTPIIVGGTYLYLKHLLYGVETQVEPNWPLRKELDTKTVFQLQQILKKLNARSFELLNNSDKNNPRRLMRRIEIASSFKSPTPPTSLFTPSLFIGLKFKHKEDLITAIKTRVDNRLKQEAINEVEQLLKKGYTENDPGLKTIGYQQLIKYLRGNLTKEEAVNEWIIREIQYAKRQYTFMKKDNNIKWKEI